MIDIFEMYRKNPNKTYLMVYIISAIMFYCGSPMFLAIYAIFTLCNQYAILSAKNRSMWYMLISFGWINWFVLFLDSHEPYTESFSIEEPKKGISYNVNGICQFNKEPCKMFIECRQCNCDVCDLNK